MNSFDNARNIQQNLTIKDILNIIWHWKFLLIIITFAGLVLGVVTGVILNSTSSKVTTIVEFQWNGITRGVYPDEQTFDYSNMFESYVYSNAIEELELENISTNQLRSAVQITPIIPNSVVALIEQELRDGNQMSYFATEYKITLMNGDLKITIDQGRLLLNKILDLFKEDFSRKYVKSTVISNYIVDDFSLYDYRDSLTLLISQTEMIKSAIDSVMPEASDYISTDTGIGFNDILIRTDLAENIDLNYISASINNYLLTKNNELLIDNLTYQNELYQLELDKKTAMRTELEALIATYAGTTTVVLIPGVDPTQTIEIDPYINTLYSNLVTVNERIISLTHDIQYYETLINRYLGLDPEFDFTVEEQNQQKSLVDAKLISSSLVISALVDDLDSLLKEYQTYMNRALVKPLVAPEYESEQSILVDGAIGMIIGACFGLLTIFITDSNKKNKKTISQ